MTDKEKERNILEYAYKAKKKGGPFTIYEAIKDWAEEDKKGAPEVANFMTQKKNPWVRWSASGGEMEITEEGIEEYEREHEGE